MFAPDSVVPMRQPRFVLNARWTVKRSFGSGRLLWLPLMGYEFKKSGRNSEFRFL